MKVLLSLLCLILVTAFAGCDLRSDTAKKEMEKFSGTPTPELSPIPTEVPIDPADAVQVDTSVVGEWVTVNGYDKKQSIDCKKYDRIMVNGGRSTVTIKGACSQLVINGDTNQITSDAVSEIIVNGSENTVNYQRYVNGKRPIIKDNASENTIEKIARSTNKK